ncbi:MAG: glycogen-binding domain-containing protein [Limisphaerales bacterium]
MQNRHTQATLAPARPGARPPSPTSDTPAERRVEFILNMPQARSAAVAGTFNNWNAKQTPMRKESGNVWKTTVSLAPGRHQYRFVVDGQWISDPNAKESVRNDFGSTNSVLVV